MWILQAHLLDGRGSGGGTVDSARQNLAATFVNAFVNAGFGQVCLKTTGSHHKKSSSCLPLILRLVWFYFCICRTS